jgi:hypothetical protein
MTTISFDTIQETYNECLAIAAEAIPLYNWSHMPAGLKLTELKGIYGQANILGEVFIHAAFIGTKAFAQLKSTINHELAHLIQALKKVILTPFRG